MTCGLDGVWYPSYENLDPCIPTFCQAPPIVQPENSLWSLTYKLYFQKDISPIKTDFIVECPKHTNFIDGVTEFHAECQTDGWHVSHPIGNVI